MPGFGFAGPDVDAGETPGVTFGASLSGWWRSFRRVRWPGSRCWDNLIANALKPAGEALGNALRVAPVVDIASSFLVDAAVPNDEVSQHQKAMGDSDRRLLHAGAGGDAVEEGRQSAVFHVSDCPGILDEDASQITIALRVRPLKRLPALSELPGQSPAQLAR